MTSHERENPHSTEPDNPDTEVITIAAPAPVFVDSTGRRSRRLRRLAYAFGALVMTYGGLIGVSLAGGPVRSSAVLPLPGLEPETESERVPPRPGPTPAAPAPSPSKVAATARYITEAMPRRTFVVRPPAPRAESNKVAPKPPAATPSPSASPKPSASTKPTESTTTKPTTKPVSVPPTTGTPTTTTPAPKPTLTVPPIVGPVPPGSGTGGQGGGSVLGPVDDPSTVAPKPPAATPTEAKPAAAKPTEAKPAAAKPTEAKPAATEETDSKPAAAVLIKATPSVELAELAEQVEADPEPTVDDTPADEDDA